MADEDFPSRTFYLCHSPFLANLPSIVTPTSRYFALFLAMDARGIRDIAILDLARAMLKKGLACLCSWGPGCERVHDLFDEAMWPEIPNPTDGNVIMTTWHSNEPLKYALWYFAHAAFAAEDYSQTCTDWVAGCVGNPEWEQTIKKKLQGLARLHT